MGASEQSPVPTQLRRNQACLPCRRRRIKCDAAKPHCSSCVRSHYFLKRTQPDEQRDARGVQCFYEAHEEDQSHAQKKRRQSDEEEHRPSEALLGGRQHTHEETPGGDGKVKLLEAKVAELEALLRSQTLYSQSSVSSGGFSSFPPTPSHPLPQQPSASSVNLPHPLMWEWAPKRATGLTSPPERDVDGRPIRTSSGSSPSSLPAWNPTNGSLMFDTPQQEGSSHSPPGEINFSDVMPPGAPLDASVGPNPTPLMQVFYHGYPPNLPSPPLLEHIVHTFFDRVPTIFRLFHRATFLARLALPPTHSNYPPAGTLHAICAVTSRYTAAVRTLSIEELIARTGDMPSGKADTMSATYLSALNEDFGERHAVWAKEEVYASGGNGGAAMFEACRAALVLGAYFHQHARWVDGWAISGLVARMLIPLGLILDTENQPDVKIFPFKRTILPPAKNDVEREERLAVLWTTVMMLEISSASSGWAGALAMDEVTARLPAAYQDFDTGVAPLNPQTHRSLDLFINHPVVDPYVLHVKLFILIGRCCRFTRQWRNLSPEQRQMAGPETPEFRALDTSVQGFILSVPPSMRDPIQISSARGSKLIDADLFGVHILPHCCIILLHEPFADLSDPSNMSAKRILTAARAVLSFVYLLTGSSIDWSAMLHPVFSFSFFTAARTLVLFLQRAIMNGDYAASAALRSEIEVFRLAFIQFGRTFAMGVRHASMLCSLIEACEKGELNEPKISDLQCPRQPLHFATFQSPLPFADQYEENHDVAAKYHPDTQFVHLSNAGAEVLSLALDGKRGFMPTRKSPPIPQAFFATGGSIADDFDWDWSEGASMGSVRMGPLFEGV